jgi:hypothetical protein
MNQSKSIRSDDVLRLKIIILVVYLVLTVAILFLVNESNSSSLSQLVLQLGSVVKDILLHPEQP